MREILEYRFVFLMTNGPHLRGQWKPFAHADIFGAANLYCDAQQPFRLEFRKVCVPESALTFSHESELTKVTTPTAA